VLAVLSGDESDGTAHELVASALTGLLQAGWTDEQACRAVEDSPGLCDRVGASERRGWGWLLRIAAVQRVWLAQHPASDHAPGVRVELAAARQALHAWTPTDELRARLPVPQLANLRAVGDAVLGLADELGRQQHLSVGVRELAERAGVSVGTVRKALPVWRAVGLLVQVEGSRWADGVQLAATYRLELSAIESDSTSAVLVSPSASGTVGHDAWRHGALGHGGWDAWALLHPHDPADPDELAALLGVSRRTVLRRLERLQVHRLVTRTAHGWTRCAESAAVELLTIAAVHEQSDGAGERQRERHATERAQQRDAHERWVAARKAEHRRQLLEHAVREPDELVPGGGWVPLDKLVGQLREHGDELARERTPAESWAEQDELTAPELVSELVRLGERLRSGALASVAEQAGAPFRRVQDALAGPLEQMQRASERVARWAVEHEHELQAERERQGVSLD
jgi:DNA-binding MarR family transcriptional regulator